MRDPLGDWNGDSDGEYRYTGWVRDWSDIEFAAYVAGFTDGEGWMAAPPEGGLRIVLANCERIVLERMRDRLGFGAIRSQIQKPHWRERHVLVISNATDCETFLRMTLPYLIIKRRTAEAMLTRCDEWRAAIAAFNERNRLIREAIASGERQKDIAARFGVSTQTVSRIKLGHTWPSERPKNARGLQGRVRPHQSWSSSPARQLRGDEQSTHLPG
jgi:hypothetical protein